MFQDSDTVPSNPAEQPLQPPTPAEGQSTQRMEKSPFPPLDPVPEAKPAAETPAAPSFIPSSTVSEESKMSEQTPIYEPVAEVPAEPKKSKTWLIILIVVLVLLCCCCAVVGGLGYYAYQNGDQWFNSMDFGALLPLLG